MRRGKPRRLDSTDARQRLVDELVGKIICDQFGAKRTQADVALELGITRQAVEYTEQKACWRLGRALRLMEDFN